MTALSRWKVSANRTGWFYLGWAALAGQGAAPDTPKGNLPMTTMTVQLRSLDGTQAAIGWAGAHTVVVDRPNGKAGGMGLGFNGGELLGLAIGGCFCNDLHYVAADMGIALRSLAIDVTMTFEGTPLLATRAEMRVDVAALAASADIDLLIQRASEMTAIGNSLRRGLPVEIVSANTRAIC
jgi:organic hydroperoxide reductase OsmC/OhrA